MGTDRIVVLVVFVLLCIEATQCSESASNHGLGGILTRLRGGSEQNPDSANAASQQTEDPAAQAQAYVKEQMDYWNSLTKQQQEEMLSNMDPEQRAQTEAFLAGKPRMTITEESLKAWNAMSPAEQEEQLKTMTAEQQEAIKAAVAGDRATVDVGSA